MSTFYRLNGRKLTYAEYWRLVPDPVTFLFTAGLKLIGLPIGFRFTVPRPDRLFLVDFDELPGPARAALGPLVDAAEAAGFRLVFCHRLAVPEPHRLTAAAVLLDKTGRFTLSAMFARNGLMTDRQMTCSTWFTDGSRGVTTTMRKTFEPVPGAHVVRCPGAGPASLAARHREHLAVLGDEGLVPARLDPDQLPDLVHQTELRFVDFHIGRGVFVPMTADEVDRVCPPGR